MHRRAPLIALLLLLAAACAPSVPAIGVGPASSSESSPASSPASSSESSLAASLEAVMAAAYPADGPGATAIVVRDGVTLLRGGWGLANVELGVPLRADHVLRVGSVTKQFTGVAILMLAEEGRLSLDDPLTRFFPDYPTGGRTVTIEHLLGHTSGIRSYTAMSEWAPLRQQELTVDEMIAIFSAKPFDFEPGERWSYNNSGYFLLGAIIERVSGMPYNAFIETRIFRPLGMTSSHYDTQQPVIPGRAAGYTRDGGAWLNAPFLAMSHPYAAGALASSVDDLARWDAAITRGELLGAGSWRRAFQPIRLNDGQSTGYGAGWMSGRLGPFATLEHSGGINGFLSFALRVPEAGLFVAVLANADAPVTAPGAVALRLAGTALGAAVDLPAVAIEPARLRDYVGAYRVNPAVTRTISIDDQGRLVSQRTGGPPYPLRPIGDDLFLFPDTGSRIRFLREAGRVTAMVLEPRAGMSERAEREP